MKKQKVLILGDGLLGSELHKQAGWDYLSRSKDGFDFYDVSKYVDTLNKYDIIVNCIANTNTYSDEKSDHWGINYACVADLVDMCNYDFLKLVHISTDYIYSGSVEHATELDIPVHNRTWYGYTKLLGDAHVQLKSDNYLIIRTSFKPTPWKYDNAITTQVTNGEYVDQIASKIITLIEADATGVYNVGSPESHTLFDLAKQTKEDVSPSDKILNENMPTDTSMSTVKFYERVCKIKS